MISLGKFEKIEYGSVSPIYVYILQILSALALMVIVLNLLIAVISGAFERINKAGERASYREKASLIAESQHLISKEETDEYCGSERFLLYAKDMKLTADEEFSSEYQLK